ncbi:DUF2252 family protein [Cytophagaceae bacterium DM2B3-1]|uniref:DUF2252 family protein n=1 Tax=Xanthocytophaga flava TaxID=3048013 RepID=A0ABT7CUV3_9BACT|nr:DUF2252 family protein [Xanthocytophaga flavus]MDJ1497550.1 DUF2252 family protein [Xanthocytophaga flavus]
MLNIPETIHQFNKDRDARLLPRKYAQMAANPLSFFRGCCHLFYQTIQQESFLHQSPIVWSCGDLHLENFGSYKGHNSLTYFDINDFDESLLGPALWELVRITSGIFLATDLLHFKRTEQQHFVKLFLKQYTTTLQTGNPRLLERDFAQGPVRDFMKKLSGRKQKDIFKGRVKKQKGKLVLDTNSKKALPINPIKKESLMHDLQNWLDAHHYHGKVLDIAHRIAGTGSLGMERYIVLSESGTKDKKKKYRLWDLKKAVPSATASFTKVAQPKWDNEAHRIVAIQQRMQAFSPAFLTAMELDQTSFVLKQLQPSEDKIDFASLGHKPKKIIKILENIAQLLAWAQLRSGGRQGSSITDDLITFSQEKGWQKNLMAYTEDLSEQMNQHHQSFTKAHQDGFFINRIR